MGRLIDREKVIKGIECLLTDGKCDLFNCPYGEVGSCLNAVLYDAIELLKEQKAQKFFVDESGKIAPIPVIVRCKDCKWLLECENGELQCEIKQGWFPVKPDWFCADGEKKSD